MSRWYRIVVFALMCLACESAVGNTPILEVKKKALEAIRSEDWSEAALQYARWVVINPNDGAVWHDYGLALLRLGQYDDARAAYEKALVTGWRPEGCYYNLACVDALSGQTGAAIDALANAYANGFVDDALVHTDEDLSSLHDSARFREIVGWPDASVTSRRDRWAHDLDFLARRVREVHWRPFANISEALFDSAIAAMRDTIDHATDLQLRLMIQSLLVRIGDGHTGMVSDFFRLHHGTQDGPPLAFLPVETFWFDDGVRIVAAASGFESLDGAMITSVNGVPTDDILQRLNPYVSRDNAWGVRWGLMQAFTDPHLLEGLGLGDAKAGFSFSLATRSGSDTTVVLSVGGPEFLERQRVDQIMRVAPTLFYQEKQKPLWLKAIGNALYVRIDRIANEHGGENFADFTDRIFRTAEESDAQVLIVDLRDNLGGQGHLTRPLLHRLIASERFNRDGHLFVLAGRKTFSAAMAFAAQLELHTHAMFVGEPTGSRPNFVGESSIITLPYSQLALSISSRYHQNGDSNDKRFWIAPDIPVVPNFDALVQGRDPAIDAILETIK